MRSVRGHLMLSIFWHRSAAAFDIMGCTCSTCTTMTLDLNSHLSEARSMPAALPCCPFPSAMCTARPCLAVLDDQVRHLAGLLSCLPPELDVTGRLKDALDHYSVKKKEVPPLAANEDPGRAPGAPLVMGWGDAGMQRQQMLSRM